METAPSPCAEVYQRFIGHHFSCKKWPGLDRHRAVAADAPGDRNALGRINRRSRRFACSSITERRVCHERFRIARVRRRVSTRRSGRVLFGARYSWSGRTDWAENRVLPLTRWLRIATIRNMASLGFTYWQDEEMWLRSEERRVGKECRSRW